MATRIYRTPFAATGDKEALATVDQPDGKVSLQTGWTPDYELPNENANYRPVGRAEMNGVFNELTAALGEMQLNGFAQWQAIDSGWPAGAQVSHEGLTYRSLIDSNLTVPGAVGANWVLMGSGIATTAQAQALTDDSVLITPKKLDDAFLAGQVLTSIVNQRFPGRLTIKSGLYQQGTPSSANFATPFPIACIAVVGAESAVAPGAPDFVVVQFASISATGFNPQLRNMSGSFPSAATVRYIALGY